MASTPAAELPSHRALRRSRFGCRNCKLRKVKCDQAKPLCKRCTSFGVLCNFASNVTDLQPISTDLGSPLISRGCRGQAEIRPSLSNGVWTSDASSYHQLSAKCQDFVTRYLERSLTTPHDPHMRHVNQKLLELAFDHPYLMHASLAVASAYDRFLNGASTSDRTQECFHSYRSTVLLNKRLRQPILPQDKDAIWGTAAALVISTFSSPPTRHAEKAWPLRPTEPSDLDWLRVSSGKMALWDTVDPLRPGSIFRTFSPIYAQMNAPLPEKGIDGIPQALAALCGLHASSTAGDNPYLHAAHVVSRVMSLPDGEVTTGHAQVFMQTIQGDLRGLLWERDHVALLLLYLWYRAASRSIWWVGLRARVEATSIYSFLRRYHGGNDAIQMFLQASETNGLGGEARMSARFPASVHCRLGS